MRWPRKFQFSLRALVCAHLVLAAGLGLFLCGWPYYRVSAVVESWHGKDFESALAGFGAMQFFSSNCITLDLSDASFLTDSPSNDLYRCVWQEDLRVLCSAPRWITVRVLRRALLDAHEEVRRCAVIALGHLGKDAAEAVPGLAHVLFPKERELHRKRRIWRQAVMSLGKIATPEARQVLQAVAEDPPDAPQIGYVNEHGGEPARLFLALEECGSPIVIDGGDTRRLALKFLRDGAGLPENK